MLSTVFLNLVSVLFSLSLPLILFNHEPLRTLRMSLIDIAKVLKQAVTEIWVMGRVAGKKAKVVAFKQQRRRQACADAQSGQRLC